VEPQCARGIEALKGKAVSVVKHQRKDQQANGHERGGEEHVDKASETTAWPVKEKLDLKITPNLLGDGKRKTI